MLIFAAGIVPDKTHTGFGVTILGISHIQKGLFLSKMKKKRKTICVLQQFLSTEGHEREREKEAGNIQNNNGEKTGMVTCLSQQLCIKFEIIHINTVVNKLK